MNSANIYSRDRSALVERSVHVGRYVGDSRIKACQRSMKDDAPNNLIVLIEVRFKKVTVVVVNVRFDRPAFTARHDPKAF